MNLYEPTGWDAPQVDNRLHVEPQPEPDQWAGTGDPSEQAYQQRMQDEAMKQYYGDPTRGLQAALPPVMGPPPPPAPVQPQPVPANYTGPRVPPVVPAQPYRPSPGYYVGLVVSILGCLGFGSMFLPGMMDGEGRVAAAFMIFGLVWLGGFCAIRIKQPAD